MEGKIALPDSDKAVLLVGAKTDPQIRRVACALKKMQVPTHYFDAVAFPQSGVCSLGEEGIRLGRRSLPPICSVYLRGTATHPLTPGNEEELAARPHGFVAQCDEKQAFIESFLLQLEAQGAHLVNAPAVNRQHSQKPWQLALLRAAKLPVPQTLSTNDPAAVRRFFKTLPKVIYKPLSGGALVQPLTSEDLATTRLTALANAPVLFQEYIEGLSIRVYVVGKKVVAAAVIHSPHLDYRQGEEAVVPVRLLPAERKIALCAAQACGMCFSGVDLIRRKDDTCVVLECNPSPMFAVFEDKTGLNIATPLARLLARR